MREEGLKDAPQDLINKLGGILMSLLQCAHLLLESEPLILHKATVFKITLSYIVNLVKDDLSQNKTKQSQKRFTVAKSFPYVISAVTKSCLGNASPVPLTLVFIVLI